MNAPDERTLVGYFDALAMLPPDDMIHTYREAPGAMVLIGADWERGLLIELIQNTGAELAGPNAESFGHRLVVFDEHGPLFIETVPV